MALTLVTAPAREPVTLQQAKDHSRVIVSDDDSTIEANIKVAREHVEIFLGRKLITQTWDLFLDWCFPKTIILPTPPAQSVVSVKYLDTDGIQQTLASTEYKVDVASNPARIVEAWEKTWPTTRSEINTIEVQFITGYGSNEQDVPEPIKQAILLLAANYYEHREPAVPGVTLAEIPHGVQSLLYPYRDLRFS